MSNNNILDGNIVIGTKNRNLTNGVDPSAGIEICAVVNG
jgi:hypothetical protein